MIAAIVTNPLRNAVRWGSKTARKCASVALAAFEASMATDTSRQRAQTKSTQLRTKTGKAPEPAPKKAATLPGARIAAIFTRFEKANPAPRSDLEYTNAYTLLIAVVLSAQTTDAGVNKATRPLFRQVDTPEKMVALGEEKLVEAIKTIGLFRNKAKNVIALSRQLVEMHGGEVPDSREALEALPGVGRKTANVVLNIAFGQPVIAVDTHILRVANRTGLAPGKTPLEVEQGLERIVPGKFLLHAHHWLILHGRYVCKAKKPECPRCIIADLCPYEPKTV